MNLLLRQLRIARLSLEIEELLRGLDPDSRLFQKVSLATLCNLIAIAGYHRIGDSPSSDGALAAMAHYLAAPPQQRDKAAHLALYLIRLAGQRYPQLCREQAPDQQAIIEARS